MNYYPFPENKYWKAGMGAVLLALLLLTRDAMYSMMVWDFYTCQFLSLGIIGVLGLAFLFVNRKNLKAIVTDSRMCLILFAVVVTALPMAAKRDFQLMYFSIILGMLFAVFLSYFKTLKDVARWYVVTMCILGIWSILCAYVLRIFIDTGMVPATKYINGAGFEFYSFIFSIVPDTYVKTRNFGLFREPGVYQFFIMLALFLNNYTVQWKKQSTMWVINVILAVTMLTTLATGGVAELGLFVILVFFEKKLYKNKLAVMTAVVVVIGMAAGLTVICMQKGELYSGCYARVCVSVFAYNSNGKRGIGFGLEAVQKLHDGDPLGGGVSVADAFGGAPAVQQPAPMQQFPQNAAPMQQFPQNAAPMQQYQQPAPVQYQQVRAVDPITGLPL